MRKMVKDQSLLTKPLKQDIKWTRKRLTMLGIGILIPYSALMFYVISSGVPMGAIISLLLFPTVLVLGYSAIYNLTKNL